MPFREDRDLLSRLDEIDSPARRAVEDMPAGEVLVMTAVGIDGCEISGGILAMRLKVRGVAGVVDASGQIYPSRRRR